MTQKFHGSHESQEGHKIGAELRHGNFHGAHNEMMKELHNHPHEFGKLLKSINHDLKQHHQNPLSIEHDHGKHISHIHFGKHDIYDSHNCRHHEKSHGAKRHQEPQAEAPQKKYEAGRKHTDLGDNGDKAVAPYVDREQEAHRKQMKEAAAAQAAQTALAEQAAKANLAI